MLCASGIKAFTDNGTLYTWNADASEARKVAVLRAFMRAVLGVINDVLEDEVGKYASAMSVNMSVGWDLDDLGGDTEDEESE